MEGLERIEHSAFSFCTSLSRIDIPASVKNVGTAAFFKCNQLVDVTIALGLLKIEDNACASCAIERIQIPSSVKSIGDYAFGKCEMLVTIQLNEGLTSIGYDAFFECKLLRGIKCPSSVQTIENRAFCGCEQLKYVELCEGLGSTECDVFSKCTSLTHVALPCSLRLIDERAFAGCLNLRAVGLSAGLQKIGCKAFMNCVSLERVVIPSTVNEIDSEAFKDCPNLVSVTFCKEIEALVSEVWPRNWWRRIDSEVYWSAYGFLHRFSIAERLGMINIREWRSSIQDMLHRTPSIEDYKQDIYFRSIDAKHIIYERLMKVASLLQLALWKSISGHATVIIPNVLDFLSNDKEEKRVVVHCGEYSSSSDKYSRDGEKYRTRYYYRGYEYGDY